MKEYDFLKFEVTDHLAKLTLDRPEAMNALNPPLWNSIIEAMKEVRDNKSIWVVLPQPSIPSNVINLFINSILFISD